MFNAWHRSFAAWGVVMTFGASCAGAIDRARARRMEEVRPRASFDFGCAEADLQLHALNEDSLTVGVTGCGKRATYVYASPYGPWVLNALEGKVPAQTDPTGQPPEQR